MNRLYQFAKDMTSSASAFGWKQYAKGDQLKTQGLLDSVVIW